MTKAKKPRVKKTKPIIDFITVNEIRYVMSNININECGQIETSDITIKHLYADIMNGELCIDPIIQRLSGQWNRMMQSSLIVSIIKKRPCGTIILAKGEATSKNYSIWTLLDGLQRVTAVCDFISGKYALSKNTQPISCCFTNENNNEEKIGETYDIAGKRFSQLPKVIQDSILDYSFLTYQYKGFTDTELDEIMFCANSGKAPTVNQKLRYYLGSDNLRKLVPMFDSTIWEEVKDCKKKNDTVLACVLRILMLFSAYGDFSLGSGAMNKFVKEYRNKVLDVYVEKSTNLVEQFAEIKMKDMTDAELKLLNGCIIPHIIWNLDVFNRSSNPENKTYIDFLRYFWASDDFNAFNELSKAGGSGGSKYSCDNVCGRQKIIDDCLETFLDHIHSESVEIVANNYPVETTNNIDDNDIEEELHADDADDDIFSSDFDEDVIDDDIIDDVEDDIDDDVYDNVETSDNIFNTGILDNEEGEYGAQEETGRTGESSVGNNTSEKNIAVESFNDSPMSTDFSIGGQADIVNREEKSISYLYANRFSTGT